MSRQKPIRYNGRPLHPYYYYDRDPNNRPINTACFITDGDRHAVGYSYCHPNDNPNKAEGRRIAYSRAVQAYFGQLSYVRHGHIQRYIAEESLWAKFVDHYRRNYNGQAPSPEEG